MGETCGMCNDETDGGKDDKEDDGKKDDDKGGDGSMCKDKKRNCKQRDCAEGHKNRDKCKETCGMCNDETDGGKDDDNDDGEKDDDGNMCKDKKQNCKQTDCAEGHKNRDKCKET